jgi:hypothetical protein
MENRGCSTRCARATNSVAPLAGDRMDETILKLECLKLEAENAPQPDPKKTV